MYRLMDFLTDSLTPTDTQMGALASADWWQYVKPHFDNEIWQYYFDRIVFCNRKFPEDNDDITYHNIIKSFVINLQTKARQYERLYNAAMADYNPLWNVDGVTGVITQDTHTGTDTVAKSGSDTSTLSGRDVDTLSGSDVSTLSGSDEVTETLDVTTDIDITKDDTTRTGNETIAKTGTDTSTVGVTTFDDTEHFKNKEQSGTLYGSTDTHTYNNVKDSHELDQQNVVDSDKGVTTEYGKVDTMAYGKVDTMGYNSQTQDTKNLTDKHVEMQIRQGNIGVTKSSELLMDTLDLYTNELMDFIKLVVRECVNTCTYSVEGV